MGARVFDDYDDDDEDTDAGERQTISFFDQSVSLSFLNVQTLPPSDSYWLYNNSILREEGQTDIFLSRRWWCSESSSEESDEEKDSEDDEDRYLT